LSGQGKDTGGKDTGGKDTGGKDTGGKDTGGKDTGGKDTGGKEKTVEFVRAEIKGTFNNSGKASNALKEIKKQDNYKEILKNARNLEEALAELKSVEALEKFRSVFESEYNKAQEKTHMQKF